METEKNTEKQSNFRLIWSFLKGSKALFAVCIISAALKKPVPFLLAPPSALRSAA